MGLAHETELVYPLNPLRGGRCTMFIALSRHSDRCLSQSLRRGGRRSHRPLGDRQPHPELIRLENRTLLSVNIGSVFEGVDYNGSNCGCYPPDPNAAVGNNDVVELVNTQIRVYDKT